MSQNEDEQAITDVSFLNDSQQPLLLSPDRAQHQHHHHHQLSPPPIITLNNSDTSLPTTSETTTRRLGSGGGSELLGPDYDSSSTTITSVGSSNAPGQFLQDSGGGGGGGGSTRLQQRRRSIFDYLNEEDTFNAEHTSFNQLLMSTDESTGCNNKQQNMRQILSADNVPRLNNNNNTNGVNNNNIAGSTSAASIINTSSLSSQPAATAVQVSFVSDDKINISVVNRREMRSSEIDYLEQGGANSSNATSDNESLTSVPSVNKMIMTGNNGTQSSATSTSDKRVEFTIGNPKSSSSSRLTRSRPKSVLKRYNMETHSLMSQNVDENEEYEAENSNNHRGTVIEQESKFNSAVDETTTATTSSKSVVVGGGGGGVATSHLSIGLKVDSSSPTSGGNSLSPNQHRQLQRHSITNPCNTNLLLSALSSTNSSSQNNKTANEESTNIARRLSTRKDPTSGSNNENNQMFDKSTSKTATTAAAAVGSSSNQVVDHGEQQQVSDVNNNNSGLTTTKQQQHQLQHQSSTQSSTQYATKQATAAAVAKKKKKNKFSFKISKYDAPCQHNEIFVRLDELVVLDGVGGVGGGGSTIGNSNHTTTTNTNSLDITGGGGGSSSMFHHFHKPQSHHLHSPSSFFHQHHHHQHHLFHPSHHNTHSHHHHSHSQHSQHQIAPPAYEWREVSRWIKYEQHVDSETSIWSKPYVGALIYQSLLYLKTGLQYGTVLLKCEHDKLSNIVEEMIQDFIDSGHMNKENRELLKKTLLSRHRTSNNNSSSSTNNNAGGGGSSSIRKKSTLSEFFPYGSRRQSTFTSAGDHQSQSSNNNNKNNLSSENASVVDVSRKSSGIQLSDLAMAFGVGNKNKKMMSRSDANLLNKNGSNSQSMSNALPHRENSVKFFEPSQDGAASLANCSSFENNLQQQQQPNATTATTTQFQYKRRRSTLALLKSTLGQSSKLTRSDLSIKGLSMDAESLIIFVGTVDYLDRPVMSFVRLSNSQVLDDLGSDVKCKFLFVLIGPRNENIDYLEIGRCMGTLMTNKEFHDCVYRANDRRELIEGITSFINRSLCVVVPAGEFDNDLMLPILEWARSKMKSKREKQLMQQTLSANTLTTSDKMLLTGSSSNAGLTSSLSPTSPLACKGRNRSVLGGSMINDKLMGYGRAVSELYYNRSNSANKNQTEHSSSGGVNNNNNTPGTPSVTGVSNSVGVDQMLPSEAAVNFLFESELVYNHEYDPFQKTGRLFGNLLRELKYRYSLYWSDFVDGLNIHCFIAFIFIFTICIATSLSFGGILADKTNKWFGVNEMLIATSMNGVIFGLFSAQPLMILGSTGPFLVFEEMLYMLCKKFCLEFLVVRCWVAMWVFLFSLIMVAFEAVHVIRYVTRFTEEIFAFLIASVFLTDAVKKIIQVFNEDPIRKVEEYCRSNLTWSSSPLIAGGEASTASSMLSSSLNETGYTTNSDESWCVLYQMETNLTQLEHTHQPRPNIALLSLILLIGTCCIALSLKKLRRSSFLGARARRTLSDVGVLISIILMTLVDSLIKAHTGVETPKLDIPNSTLTPTKYRNEWFVSPFGVAFNKVQFWVPLIAMVPASLVFIVLFFEIELTGLILNTKHRQLKKGSGFHLDLLLSATLMNVNSLFGLPWTCAAPVRTLAHWASLTVFSKTYVPGEKARLIDVKEQRLTNICVHLAIGVCLLAKSALQMIPISVLFGVFLYFGLVSLSGTQLYERIKLIFVPHKYCPNAIYARGVRPSKRNLFTFIQVFFIFSLLLIKSFNQISYVFSIILVFLVPLRIFIMPKIFTKKELEQLDNQDEMIDDTDSTLDFYEVAHMPI